MNIPMAAAIMRTRVTTTTTTMTIWRLWDPSFWEAGVEGLEVVVGGEPVGTVCIEADADTGRGGEIKYMDAGRRRGDGGRTGGTNSGEIKLPIGIGLAECILWDVNRYACC